MSKTINMDDTTYKKLKDMAYDNGRTISGQVRYLISHSVTDTLIGNVMSVSNPSMAPEKKEVDPIMARIAELQEKIGAIDKDIELHGGEEPPEYYDMFNEIVALQKKLQEKGA